MQGIAFGSIIIIALLYGTPILLFVWFVSYLIRAEKERRRLRLEVGRLAEEVALMRQEAARTADRG